MCTKHSEYEEMGIPMPSNCGYQGLAAIMGSVPSLLIYKRFSKLNAKRILHMQAELIILEVELNTLVQEDRTSGDPTREDLDTCWASLKGTSEDMKLNLQWEKWNRLKENSKNTVSIPYPVFHNLNYTWAFLLPVPLSILGFLCEVNEYCDSNKSFIFTSDEALLQQSQLQALNEPYKLDVQFL